MAAVESVEKSGVPQTHRSGGRPVLEGQIPFHAGEGPFLAGGEDDDAMTAAHELARERLKMFRNGRLIERRRD